jgi:MFS family permease
VLVYGYVSRIYEAANRATGLGWAARVGRLGAICGPLLGGALLDAGIAYPWGFYAFAAVGALGAIGITVVRAAGSPRLAPAARSRASIEGG